MRFEEIRAAHPLLAQLPEETLARLDVFAQLLRKWQRSMNLIGSATLSDFWIRHVADSLQVSSAEPNARRWVDLGSGAGFPGLVTAIKYADDPGAKVHLIDADQRKCAFLREAVRITAAPAVVQCGRIEKILPELTDLVDAISARAVAPLSVLLGYASPLLEKGAIGLFLRGKDFEAELTAALTAGKYIITTIQSQTCSTARLLRVIYRRD
ncbi:MAG TPA: 16S rRNA (guanine(527)-N(7))-methyltransferase RsmG [Methylocella sp.]|nr:16S rRNA (guanine(527)-N(7))-methyltransferase RsmG [Methylocella sp.]